ncbi:MAG: response regulator transcription factor [Acidobacteriota bacterium]|nr:response regulator transcription factor [Acidobacteriota bacterium]
MDTPNDALRVLLVDDHAVVLRGLEALLAEADEVEVVGAAGDGGEAVELAHRLRPDVILMDLLMPGVDGTEATAKILRRHPAMRIVVLTGADIGRHVLPALRAGALGYVSKSSNLEELLTAIRQVAAGRASFPYELTRRLLAELDAPNPVEPLSPREQEILREVARGLSNHAIAQRLHISAATVRTHVSNIFGKIAVSNRVEATLYALRHGIAFLEDASPSPPPAT